MSSIRCRCHRPRWVLILSRISQVSEERRSRRENPPLIKAFKRKGQRTGPVGIEHDRPQFLFWIGPLQVGIFTGKTRIGSGKMGQRGQQTVATIVSLFATSVRFHLPP